MTGTDRRLRFLPPCAAETKGGGNEAGVKSKKGKKTLQLVSLMLFLKPELVIAHSSVATDSPPKMLESYCCTE